jgi:hypothetical protein
MRASDRAALVVEDDVAGAVVGRVVVREVLGEDLVPSPPP